MEYVRIPRRRVAVLIGRKGTVKKAIEKKLKVKLGIDAEDGVVTIENRGDDVLAEWKGRDIVKAVGRGLNPEKAMRLCSDDYILDIIDLQDIVGRSEKALKRQKARIIGREGRTRKHIEEMTKAWVAVSGKSVTIVGTHDEVAAAREAVVMLAEGIPHGVVYRVLQNKARKLKEKRLSLWK
jgi:ribosomal RNA assembly protein